MHRVCLTRWSGGRRAHVVVEAAASIHEDKPEFKSDSNRATRSPAPIDPPHARAQPFGGWKTSGLGREGGVNCLDEFLEEKAFVMGGI